MEAPIEAQRGSRRDRERAFSGLPGRVLGWCGLGLSSLYLANLGLGAGFEFLPDVLPFVGNLDEAGATALLLWSWHALSGDPPRADGP